MNSEVQTGVKSAGWLKRIFHFPWKSWGNAIVPCVLLALKEGALSPMRGIGVIVFMLLVSMVLKFYAFLLGTCQGINLKADSGFVGLASLAAFRIPVLTGFVWVPDALPLFDGTKVAGVLL